MKNIIFSGLVGAIIGGLLGFFGVYSTKTSDYSLEFKQAQVQLAYVEKALENNIKNEGTPVYPLLNMDVNWSIAFADLNDKEFENLFYELKQLDDLRAFILAYDEEDKSVYKEQYYEKINELYASGLVKEYNNLINSRLKEAYEAVAY